MNLKKIRGLFLACAPVLLASCASNKVQYSDYRSDQIIQGTGGAVRTADGIDIWTDGTPDRKFKVIGEVQESRQGHGGRGLFGALSSMGDGSSDTDSDLAKAAKAHGGDAIVIVQAAPAASDDTDDFSDMGSSRHSHQLKAYVVQYVKDSPSGN